MITMLWRPPRPLFCSHTLPFLFSVPPLLQTPATSQPNPIQSTFFFFYHGAYLETQILPRVGNASSGGQRLARGDHRPGPRSRGDGGRPRVLPGRLCAEAKGLDGGFRGSGGGCQGFGVGGWRAAGEGGRAGLGRAVPACGGERWARGVGAPWPVASALGLLARAARQALWVRVKGVMVYIYQ